MFKTCFVASGPIHWASARYRAYWVSEEMENSIVVCPAEGQIIPEAENYIWQKSWSKEFIGQHEFGKGARHFWDVCDPLWWFSPNECAEIVDKFSGVAASSPELALDYMNWSGKGNAILIKDRFKLSEFNSIREHGDTKTLKIIWFGMSQNRISLFSAFPTLLRLRAEGYDFSLTIFDDDRFWPLGDGSGIHPIQVKWSLENEANILASHDVALLPPYPGDWGRVKSSNKADLARVCGLCVSDGSYDSLVPLFDYRKRQKETEKFINNIQLVDVAKSAEQWKEFIKHD